MQWKFRSEGVIPYAKEIGVFPSLRSSLVPRLTRSTLKERTQGALTLRKAMAEAQAQLKLKRALKYQWTITKDHTYSPGNKVLVWLEKIVNCRIYKFIGSYMVLHHDERSNTISIDQNGVVKRYSPLQIRHFLEQPSILDNSVADREVEDWHNRAK